MKVFGKIGWMVIFLCLVAGAIPAEIVDRTVAVVNNQIITQYDVQQATDVVRQNRGGANEPTPADVVDFLIEQALLAQEAEAQGILVTADEINTVLQNIQKQYNLASEAALKQELAKEGKTLEEFTGEVRRQIKVQKLVSQEVHSQVDVSDEEARAYYAAYQAPVTSPAEAVTVRHIFLALPEQADAKQIAALQTQATDLVQQLRNGADFAALAKAHSATFSAKAGDELGTFKPGELAPPFDQAFTLQPGAISAPLKTDKGFYILTVQPPKIVAPATYEQLKPQIQNKLFEEKSAKRYAEWLATLKANAYVEIMK